MDRILVSRSQDPALNLAAEEVLMEQHRDLLFLWQNGPSVILGRNQNPYRECDPELLRREGVKLVRRRSGGGAVYHDLGNLNVTMVSPKSPEAVEENFRLLQRVLSRLGIQAQVSGRNDLEVEGRKVSGSAFYEREDRICHHCTLMIDVDVEKLAGYLTPARLKLQDRGIESVRSRVGNLRDWVPGLQVEDVLEAFRRETGLELKQLPEQVLEADRETARRAERYRSFQWTYGECPEYDLSLEQKFPWGLIRAELQVDGGRIRSCSLYTDSLVPEGFRELGRSLQGKVLFSPECGTCIQASGLPPEISEDLSSMLTR